MKWIDENEGIIMELSKRQKKIIEIVKENEPISGDSIAKKLGLTKPTLRSDLAVLTMTGILDARPKVGYFYSGLSFQPLLAAQMFDQPIRELIATPVLITTNTSVRDAVTQLFMYDTGSLYVVDETTKELQGLISRKDLLRSLLNNGDNDLPVAVVMTRMPNIIVGTEDMTVFEVGQQLIQHEIDSMPIVEKENKKIVVGKMTKTRILTYFIEMIRERGQEK